MRKRNNQAFNRAAQVGQAVAAAGKIIMSPGSTAAERQAALAGVDALGDAGASRAVRTYASTVSSSSPTSPEQEALAAMLQSSREEEQDAAVIEKYRNYTNQGGTHD